LEEAEKKAQEQAAEQTVDEGVDNRARLNSYWSEQDVKRSKNVVSGLKSNFEAVDDAEKGKLRGDSAFNKSFFDQNALNTKGEPGGAKPGEGAPAKKPTGEGKPGGRFFRGSGKETPEDAQQDDFGGQAQNPQLFNDRQRDDLQQKLQREGEESRSGRADGRDSRENYSRYSGRLQQQAQQQEQFSLNDGGRQGGQQGSGQQQGGGPSSGDPMQGRGMGGFGGGMMGGMNAPATPGTPPLAYQPGMVPNAGPELDIVGDLTLAGEDYSEVAAGLASLDFTLPERGQVFNFTTPRGQIEIEARPIAQTLLARLIGLAILAGVVVVVWLVARRPARAFWQALFSTVAVGVLLAVLGLASIISGVFPLAGLLLLVAGIALAIRNRLSRPFVAAA
jgi:hypothetical protein